MAGLVSRSWKESYKSVIIISGASSGAGATHQQLTDGAGTTIPLYVASGSLRIESGKKMYFSDTDLNNYIYNSGTGVLNLVAQTSVNISPKLVVPGTLSSVTLIGSEAVIKGLVASTASFKGTVKAPTVSATTIKGTTLNMTTVSATTIKGGIQTPKGGTFQVASGTLTFASSPEYSIGLAADNKTVAIKANNVAALNVQGTKVIPGVGGIDMGANAAASRWNNIYGASTFHKALTASTVTIKGGTASLTTAKGTTATFKVMKSTSEIMLSGASFYLNAAKTTVIKSPAADRAIHLIASTKGMKILPNYSIVPTAKSEVAFGEVGNTWKAVYTDKTVTPLVSASTLTLYFTKLVASGLVVSGTLGTGTMPVTSMTTGQLYRGTGNALKIKA